MLQSSLAKETKHPGGKWTIRLVGTSYLQTSPLNSMNYFCPVFPIVLIDIGVFVSGHLLPGASGLGTPEVR